jgi:hypothetical protein
MEEVEDSEMFVVPKYCASQGSHPIAELLNVTRKFTESLEDLHKKELQQKARSKSSRHSIDFDEIPLSSRCRRMQFTPLHH